MSNIQQFNYDINLLQFIFWQYDNPSDENIAQLIQDKNTELQRLHGDFWVDWYDNVFNLDTVNEFGISVWSYILDIPLINTHPIPTKVGWGFGDKHKNFDHGNFNQNPEGVSLLTNEQRIIILKMKYRKLTTRGTIPEANIILDESFGDLGLVYMQDNLDMSVDIVFDFLIPEWILFILSEFDILPVPAGVSFNLVGP